ncbi:MAG: trimethylamine methyltransferase family protein [Gammaproteobacteria bacterium]|nr:trimethylamine methyltransferase family protein [Gammaproteobacteria bacterium]MDH3448144.1 trimethylamine methyltransferase family protein [Gammaproteobacteria bacterium]
MSRRTRRGRHHGVADTSHRREVNYRNLRNTLLRQPVFSEDRLEATHQTALRVIRELGIKVLNPEAREYFRKAGASVDETSLLVRIEPELVTSALRTAPGEFVMHGAIPDTNVTLGGDHVAFVCVGGAPHISDLDRGKRPGTLEDTRNIIKLSEHFDVLHMQSPNVESQDIPVHLRHYQVTAAQLTLSRKPFFIYSRGSAQVEDSFAMTRIARGLSQQEFEARPWCYTIINTNSPRQLDVPMCQGIIDFARAGQMSVITPFTLAGAMAPVTMPGALVLQHAEALAGIVLSQLVRPGAPVVYGSFTSNVDMKSGSPAFGTPEFVQAAFGAGQLARHIGLPWRGSAATASNAPDEQSVYEYLMSAWGSILGGVNMMVHAAGWLEGGLTGSMEKFILDVEMLQTFAEIFNPLDSGDAELAFEAIASVDPGGHFFGCDHTMARYQTAFYEPLVSDWSNFGQWTESGSKTATQRANGVWKKILEEFQAPPMEQAIERELQAFIERRSAEGGAPID